MLLYQGWASIRHRTLMRMLHALSGTLNVRICELPGVAGNAFHRCQSKLTFDFSTLFDRSSSANAHLSDASFPAIFQ